MQTTVCLNSEFIEASVERNLNQVTYGRLAFSIHPLTSTWLPTVLSCPPFFPKRTGADWKRAVWYRVCANKPEVEVYALLVLVMGRRTAQAMVTDQGTLTTLSAK